MQWCNLTFCLQTLTLLFVLLQFVVGQAPRFDNPNEKIHYLNQQIANARQARDAGDFTRSVSILKAAIGVDPAQDLLWASLGETYHMSQNFAEAVAAYRKAIEIQPANAVYHSGLGSALGKLGQLSDAVSEFAVAAQIDSQRASIYYFNMGAVLLNAGKTAGAAAAFAFVTQLDPYNADAFYWQGVNLMGASLVQSGNFVCPSGTRAAFLKYLDLQPNGKYSTAAQQMLKSISSESPALKLPTDLYSNAYAAAQPFNDKDDYVSGSRAQLAYFKQVNENSDVVWAEKMVAFWSDPKVVSALASQKALEARVAASQGEATVEQHRSHLADAIDIVAAVMQGMANGANTSTTNGRQQVESGAAGIAAQREAAAASAQSSAGAEGTTTNQPATVVGSNTVGSSSRVINGLPQCAKTQYESQDAALWVVNSCNTAVTVEFTSDSGNTWGTVDVGPSNRAAVSTSGIGYSPKKDGTVYLFTCPKGSHPEMSNGNSWLPHNYKGQYICRLP
jgi:tetratricopeptide (TPR) repeat protein